MWVNILEPVVLKQSWWLFQKMVSVKNNKKSHWKLFHSQSFFRHNQKEMADSREFGGKYFYIKISEKMILLIKTVQKVKSSLIGANPKLCPLFPAHLINIILHKTDYGILSLETRSRLWGEKTIWLGELNVLKDVHLINLKSVIWNKSLV